MGTAIKRYYFPLSATSISELLGKEIDCVLIDGAVIRGYLQEVKEHHLVIKNGIKNILKLEISNLSELTLAC